MPKHSNKTIKESFIKWLLKADQFHCMNTYKNKPEYDSLELNVDKSISNKKKLYKLS